MNELLLAGSRIDPPCDRTLYDALWPKLKHGRLIVPRRGPELRHALAAFHLTRYGRARRLRPVFLDAAEPLPPDLGLGVNTDGLVLVGQPDEFPEPLIRHTLLVAAYPASPSGVALVGDLGQIFLGQTANLWRTPVLLISGTSPWGVLAAALWAANRRSLRTIPIPESYPAYPLEAVVRLAAEPGTHCLPLGPAILETEALVCAHQRYKLETRSWLAGETRLELVSDAMGLPRAILVNGRAIRQPPGTDLFELLWYLAERTLGGKETSLNEAGEALKKANPRSLRARLYEIRHLSPDGALVESRDENGVARHRVRALITRVTGERSV